MQEEWRAVVGQEGKYEVSSLGRVRSLDRIVTYKNKSGTLVSCRKRGKLLMPGLASNGYLTAALSQKSYTIHELVCVAFIGPRPPKYATRHLDGNKLNNAASNLCYGTYTENNHDITRHDRRRYKRETVEQIRADWRTKKFTQAEIAAKHGCTQAFVSLLVLDQQHVVRP